jgi:hypothetical protein
MTAVLEAPVSVEETQSPTFEPDHDAIERLAYFRYLDRGRVDGFALDDWLAAEAELKDTQEQAISA